MGMGNNPKWKKEEDYLRKIAASCGLKEEIKWEKPSYTLNGKIVLVIQAFSDYIAVMFVKGVLMEDGKGVLTKIGPNTIVGRHIKLTSLQEIKDMESTIKKYIEIAIEVEKSGKKIEFNVAESRIAIPFELQEFFEELPEFKEAWDRLTPGRQKGYLIYFNDAKYEDTRRNRIEKYIDQIMDGVGMHDLYKAKKK